MVALACPRQCGDRLRIADPRDPAACWTCGFEDYDNYRSPELSGDVTKAFVERSGATPAGEYNNLQKMPARQRRTAKGVDWLEANAPTPDSLLTREYAGGRPRLKDSVCITFKELVEVHGIGLMAVCKHYGLGLNTVKRAIRRVS